MKLYLKSLYYSTAIVLLSNLYYHIIIHFNYDKESYAV